MTKTSDTDFLLALDIGSSTAKALLARRSKHNLEIVGIGSAEHSPGAFVSGAIANLPSVIETCDKAVATAEQMAGKDVTARQVVMSISGESPNSIDGFKHAEKIASELSLDLIAVSTTTFAIAQALTSTDPDLLALIIDIGTTTTDIALIQGVDSVKEAEALAIGTNAIARNDFSSLPTWLSGVELTIKDLSPSRSLPSRILLCGGGASLIEIPEALATTDWHTQLPFLRRPVIDLIDPASISGVENYTATPLDYSFVPALTLLRVAPDTTPSSTHNSFRTKLSRLLSH